MAKVTDVGEQPSKRAPGKKDTRRWCKGKVGREHTPELRESKWGYFGKCGLPQGWRLIHYPEQLWVCHHQVVCSTCGKILEYVIPWRECPDIPASLLT